MWLQLLRVTGAAFEGSGGREKSVVYVDGGSQCPTFTGMADFRESTGHTLTIKSGLPYHIPYHFRALKRPCPAVSNHVQPCPTMSGHVWTQVDMLIDPASGLKKSNWFAYHFRIPLYHTSAKRIRKGPNTSMIPVNLQHWPPHEAPHCHILT